MSDKLFKYDILEARGYQCELCGAVNVPFELDHGVYSKSKYRKNIPELDTELNYIVTCQTCNQRKPKKYWQPFPSYGAWAWEQNCKRYGEDVMEEWKENLPLIDKSF